MTAWLIATTLLVFVGQGPTPGLVEDDAPLGLADLAAEHAAATGRSESGEPPSKVGYRDLWSRPDAWRGRRVIVRGRVARIFRQAAYGSFPPLVEAWIEEPPGNLLCAVFAPDKADSPSVAPGQPVAFTGTFLRRIRYTADDGARLAPLIVGAGPPRVEPKADGRFGSDLDAPVSAWPDSTWAVGLIVGLAGVGVILAWRTWNRPSPAGRGRRTADSEREPEFLDRGREAADGDAG